MINILKKIAGVLLWGLLISVSFAGCGGPPRDLAEFGERVLTVYAGLAFLGVFILLCVLAEKLLK